MTDCSQNSHPYDALTPDVVFDAIEILGYQCDGRLLALNSYENRVYQIGIEDDVPVIAKFYRPERWSREAILEEHEYTFALAANDIPVVAPLRLGSTPSSLHEFSGFQYAVYPRRGGRWPELDNEENLMWLGRFIGRIHSMGAVRHFDHRPSLNIKSYAEDSFDFIVKSQFVPLELRTAYTTLMEDVIVQVKAVFNIVGEYKNICLHADCHPGNILWTDNGPHFVDFDDARTGPAIQDLWMLLSGDRQAMTQQLTVILQAYTEFHHFDFRELRLIEALRTLRMIHYSAWLARRWDDPSFPRNFPWFIENKYWEEQILAMREQSALMNEEPLVIQLSH